MSALKRRQKLVALGTFNDSEYKRLQINSLEKTMKEQTTKAGHAKKRFTDFVLLEALSWRTKSL